MKNIIQEIWEIKDIICKAVDLQDLKLFEVAQESFKKIYTEKHFLNSISTSTIDCEYESVEDMLFDREQNFGIIAVELNKDKQRAIGIDVPIVQFQFSSIFELMWWNCWMFNNFKKNAELDCPYEINMQIYSSIDANMKEIISYYDNFTDKTSKSEQQTCIEIYNEIVEAYNELYSNSKEIKN